MISLKQLIRRRPHLTIATTNKTYAVESQPCILIVGDDQATAMFLRDYLSEQGYCMQTAATLKEGLAMLDSVPCDLIIGDFEKPDTDGLSFFSSARIRRGKRAMPPILMLWDSPEDESVADGLGVADALSKPVDPLALHNCVSKLTKHSVIQ